MKTPSQPLSHELSNTVASLQSTVHSVRLKIEKGQENTILDLSQPIGHLLDSMNASNILSLAKPTSETISELESLDAQLATLQKTLQHRNQWYPPSKIVPIACTTDYLDISDLSTAVRLLRDIVDSSAPGVQLTPRKAFAHRKWTWDPLWREFFSASPPSATPADPQEHGTLYLSRWFFDPRTHIWHHANMADSGLMPDEAQQRLGAWEDWVWDKGSGEWGLDVSGELEEGVRKQGARLWVFASRWVERGGEGWVYVGGRGR